MQKLPLLSALLGAVLSVTACLAQADAGHSHHGAGDQEAIGQPGRASDVRRTITVDMSDAMRFTPAGIQARQGETIRFVVRNSGKIKHEFVLGTEQALKEHNELMKKFPQMEHADDNMVTVEPGKTAELVWKFTKAGQIPFACLQPGHYDAGMKGQVSVTATATAEPKDQQGHHRH